MGTKKERLEDFQTLFFLSYGKNLKSYRVHVIY